MSLVKCLNLRPSNFFVRNLIGQTAKASTVTGQTIFVTGGACGIGYGISDYFIKQGAKIFIMDMDRLRTEEAVHKLTTKYGQDVVHYSIGNIISESDARKAIQTCKEKFGKIDILVNNAASGMAMLTYDTEKKLAHDLGKFALVIEVNVVGTFNMSRLVAQEMSSNVPDKDGQRGLIVHMSSTAAMESAPGQVAYASSKAAINGMTLVMARDLAPIGIRVMTICPGPTESQGLKQFIQTLPKFKLPVMFPDRPASPAEMAEIIHLIAKCTYVNAACWRADAGGRI